VFRANECCRGLTDGALLVGTNPESEVRTKTIFLAIAGDKLNGLSAGDQEVSTVAPVMIIIVTALLRHEHRPP